MVERLLTLAEVADIFRISRATLYRQRYVGEPPGSLGFRVGRHVPFRGRDIDQFIEQLAAASGGSTMAIEVMELVRKAHLDKGHKSVLLALANYASKDGSRVFPGTARLTRDTGYTSRWIYKLRRDLIGMGLLVETRPSTPTQPAHYRIVLAAVRRLIEGEELSSPVEVASPPEANGPEPLNSLPRPPEVSSPNPSVEPSIEPSGALVRQVDTELDAAAEAAFQTEHNRRNKDDPIGNPSAYRNKIRENLRPRFEARARENAANDAKQSETDSCACCNDDGIVAWEVEGGAPLSQKCTHNPADYEDLELLTDRGN